MAARYPADLTYQTTSFSALVGHRDAETIHRSLTCGFICHDWTVISGL
jgi:hypothetical protein